MDDSKAVRDLTRWLRGVFLRQKKQLARVSLHQVEVGGNARVQDWSDFEEVKPDTLAREVYQAAQDDAAGLRGPTRYQVLAYEGDDDAPCTRMSFRIMPDVELSDAIGEESEPPTAQGHMAQMMRHNEGSIRTSLGATNDIIRHYQRMNDSKDAQLEKFGEMHFKVLSAYEKLMDRQYEREASLRAEARKERQMEMIIEKLEMLAPIAMNKLLSSNDPTESPPLLELQVAALLKSLPTQMIGMIQGALPPESRALFMDLYRGMRDREVAREKKKQEEADKAKQLSTSANGVVTKSKEGEGTAS